MSQPFNPGDFLIFQLESGFGLIRILAVDEVDGNSIWHISVYEDLFPDVEAAEKALERIDSLRLSKAHLALTARAFERTPAAKLSNIPLQNSELAAYRAWQSSTERRVLDRSLLLLLGMR
jgi:hypothetical protein